jgi:hypothetical protein
MKALLLTLLTCSFCSSVFAVEIKASLTGSASEAQLLTSADGQRTLREAGTADLKEVGRSQYADEVRIFLMGSDKNTDYLSVLHEIETLTLTLDMSSMTAAGEGTAISAKVQILGDDDQIRKADGTCVSLLDAQLTCRLTPTFNAFGLLENSQLTLDLQ